MNPAPRKRVRRPPYGPTITDVARAARVSTATVSRVVSNAPAGFTPETADRVRQTIAALGYIPNASAAHLRTLRSGKMLVTAPNLSNPLYWAMLQGVEAAAHGAGYALLLGDTQHDALREDRFATMLERRDADGWISLDHRLPHPAARLVQHRAPRLVCAADLAAGSGVTSVRIDNARAGADAFEHLRALGHRDIAIVAGPATSRVSRERVRGARLAAGTRAGLDLTIVHGEFSPDAGAAGLDALLARPGRPTAVLCLSDAIAVGVLDRAWQLGVRLPEDLSVVGFDDVPFACRTAPALTTVAQPSRAIGEACVQRLLEMLETPGRPASVTTLAHRLVFRGSTAQARGARSRAIAG